MVIRKLSVPCLPRMKRKSNVRILERTNKATKNLTKADRQVLWSLWGNANLMVLPKDKGKATIILNTEGYICKIATLLENPSYRRLDKDRTEATDRKTSALIRSSLPEEVAKLLRPHGSRPPRL
jgi:hypothetical protein